MSKKIEKVNRGEMTYNEKLIERRQLEKCSDKNAHVFEVLLKKSGCSSDIIAKLSELYFLNGELNRKIGKLNTNN